LAAYLFQSPTVGHLTVSVGRAVFNALQIFEVLPQILSYKTIKKSPKFDR